MLTLDHTQIAAITDTMYDLGMEPDGVRTDYSGRGMYGRTCFGIDIDGAAAGFTFKLGVALAANHPELAEELSYETVATDNMGLGTIVYWPNVTVEGADADDD